LAQERFCSVTLGLGSPRPPPFLGRRAMAAPVLYWASLVLGCLASLPTTYFGLNYVAPISPMHPFFKAYYADVIGPLVGWRGNVLHSIVGPAMVSAGVGIILAMWGTCLGLFTGELGAWANTLLLCALHGMCVIDGVAATMEFAIKNMGAVFPSTILMTLFGISYACRLAITRLEGIHHTFYVAFVALTGILMLTTLLTRFIFGIPLEDVKARLEGPDGYKQKMDDAFAGKEAGANEASKESLVSP